MNMVVASVTGIGFNEYATRMLPIAVAGWLITFAVAIAIFRPALRSPVDEAVPPPERAALDARQKVVLVALGAVVVAYPVVSWLGGPVWLVAACGAVFLLAVGRRLGHKPLDIARHEIHFDVLVFLVAVLVLSIGLRNVGLVDRLAAVYDGAGTMKIGVVSALGSAVLNNHPMSHLNMMALGGSGHRSVLAALVGGDLGPRLFPMGSLAGLLWLEMLRRAQVHVSVRRFVWVGVLATVPTLLVSLALL